MDYINLNKENYKTLKLLYEKAVISKEEIIKFEGKELSTGYVKYILERAEIMLEIGKK
jgi:hypothetical protein